MNKYPNFATFTWKVATNFGFNIADNHPVPKGAVYGKNKRGDTIIFSQFKELNDRKRYYLTIEVLRYTDKYWHMSYLKLSGKTARSLIDFIADNDLWDTVTQAVIRNKDIYGVNIKRKDKVYDYRDNMGIKPKERNPQTEFIQEPRGRIKWDACTEFDAVPHWDLVSSKPGAPVTVDPHVKSNYHKKSKPVSPLGGGKVATHNHCDNCDNKDVVDEYGNKAFCVQCKLFGGYLHHRTTKESK